MFRIARIFHDKYRLFAGSGTEPAIVCEGDEPYAIRGLISAGVGVGLMPAVARPGPAQPALPRSR